MVSFNVWNEWNWDLLLASPPLLAPLYMWSEFCKPSQVIKTDGSRPPRQASMRKPAYAQPPIRARYTTPASVLPGALLAGSPEL